MGKNKEYKTIKGKVPILLSAPHVYEHKRPSLSSKYKQGEPWTDYIVENVCSEIDAFGIVSLKEQSFDPSYYELEKSNYKQDVKNIVKEAKVKYFFDVHGLSDNYSYDFGIYYLKRFPNSKDLAYSLADYLNKGSLRNCLIQILNLPEGKQKTLAGFTTEDLGAYGLQIEISRYIREDDNLREGFVKNFSDFLINL